MYDISTYIGTFSDTYDIFGASDKVKSSGSAGKGRWSVVGSIELAL